MATPTNPFAPKTVGVQDTPAFNDLNLNKPTVDVNPAPTFQMMTSSSQGSVMDATQQTSYQGYKSNKLELPDNFPLRLTSEQETSILNFVNNYDIEKHTLLEVSTMADVTERAYHKAMDPFLDAINKYDNPKLFNYITHLQKEVDQAQLPQLIEEINKIELSLADKIRSFFNRKTPQEMRQEAMKSIMELLALRTKTLKEAIDKIESGIDEEVKKVLNELKVLENLNAQYKNFMTQFSLEAACVFGVQKRAERQFELLKQQHPDETGRMREFEEKLQAVTSRALILDKNMTMMPANQMIVKQIQEVAIKTLAETSSNMYSRFGNIKNTVVQINSLMKIKDLQNAEIQGKNLDQNLMNLRAQMMKETATQAASMSGENRIAEAEAIKNLIVEIEATETIRREGIEKNEQNFAKARSMLAEARQDELRLGLVINR